MSADFSLYSPPSDWLSFNPTLPKSTGNGQTSSWFNNYMNKWGGQKYGLLNTGISAGADLAGNFINSNGMSTTAGNIMSGIGNVVGNIPGPIGWAGKGLALAGQAVNALWGHKFNDANVAAAESATRERNNWQFGDYSNTDALLAGSMANVQLGNVSKGFLGKEGPFSNAVTNKMNQINNDRMQANLRANNSELNAYNNYQTGMIRNAIAGDSMGNVNAAASGGPLNMINGTMTPFGNRYFANGGFTHGGLFTNGFIEVNNGGSHEQNPNQGVQYGVDPQGTPNMVEEGETILDDYVFSKRIKFPKKYKDEFSLGGKIWKKSFADVSKMIAKESEERPNDPISQRSLKAMGGKLADIQEEVKAKQALDKMDPREVMAMLQQLAMMQQGGGQPQMEEQQMMQDPYQQQMMAEQGMEEPVMAACGGKLHAYGGNLYSDNRDVNLFLPGGYANNQYGTIDLQQYVQDMINNINMLEVRKRGRRSNSTTKTTPKEESATTTTPLDITKYGFLKGIKGLSNLERIYNSTNFSDNKSIANLLYHYVNNGIMDYKDAIRLFYNIQRNNFPGMKEGESSEKWLKNLLGLEGKGYDISEVKLDSKGKPVVTKDKKTGAETAVTEDKHYDWVGPEYYAAIAGSPEEFEVKRDFTGNKDLRNLTWKFNKDSDKDSVLDFFSSYINNTDPQVQAQALADYRKQQNDLYKERYDKLQKYQDLLKDIENHRDLSNIDANGQSIIDAMNTRFDEGVEQARNYGPDEIEEKTQLVNDIGDLLDVELYNNSLLSDPDLLYDLENYDNVDVSSIKGLDPESKEFSELNPVEQQIAEGKWIEENFKNNKEWKPYKEKFDKEIADEEAKKQREKEMQDLLKTSNLPTWMRYAPLAFSSIATLTDALGLTNKPDLTPYNQLIAQSDRMNKVPSVRYHPTFQPIQYQPINLNADLQQAANMYAAASRNANNITGSNMGAGIAGNITALNQAGTNYGKLRGAIADADLKNRTGIAEFNNKGAYQDAMGSLKAQQINTNNIQNAQKFGYQALSDALKYYQAEQQAANAAKQVNLTHAVNSWANVGRENMYINMINNNRAYDYGIGPNGNQWYKWFNQTT